MTELIDFTGSLLKTWPSEWDFLNLICMFVFWRIVVLVDPRQTFISCEELFRSAFIICLTAMKQILEQILDAMNQL